MFSNLGPGSLIHVLCTKGKLTYNVCTIEKVAPTRSLFSPYSSLLDITVDIDGVKKEFGGVPATGFVSTSTDYIITETKEAMISQVDNILRNRQQMLDQVDKYEDDVVECKEILKKLNPDFAKESARDNALATLTERVDAIQSEFGDIKGDVKQVLQILTKENSKK